MYVLDYVVLEGEPVEPASDLPSDLIEFLSWKNCALSQTADLSFWTFDRMNKLLSKANKELQTSIAPQALEQFGK